MNKKIRIFAISAIFLCIFISQMPVFADEADYTLLELEKEYIFNIDYGDDVDYFQFTTNTIPSYYSIEMINIEFLTKSKLSTQFTELRWSVFDKDNIEIGYYSDDRNGSFDVRLLPNTTYSLKVELYNPIYTLSETARYKLIIRSQPDPAGDKVEDAMTLDINKEYVLTIDGNRDVDWYQFTTNSTPSYYNIGLTNINLSSNLKYELFDKDVMQIAYGYISGSGTLSRKLSPDATYSLKIYSDYSGKGKYKIAVNSQPDPVGEKIEDAMDFELNKESLYSIDGVKDVDFFRIKTLPSNAYYNFTLQNIDVKNESYTEYLYISLYDADGGKIDEFSTTSKKTFAISLKPNSDYYFAIYANNNSFSTGRYKITIDTKEDEAGNSAEDALEILPNREYAFSIDGYKDVDWFRFTTGDKDGEYKFRLENVKIESYYQSMSMVLLDEDAVEITKETDDEPFTLTESLKKNSVYYLKIFMRSDDKTGRYKLSICDGVGHIPDGKWINGQQPTCNKTGSRFQNCAICGVPAISESIPTLDHLPSQWKIEKKATCAAEGENVLRCARCNLVLETKAIPALGHDFGAWTVETEATCETEGKKVKKCSRCGEILETETIPALGHDYSEWRVLREATNNKEGEEERHCNRCGDTIYREIEKLPKKWFKKLFEL